MSDTQQQQPEAVPFNETLEATDKAAGVPDGQYQLQLTRVEKYEGTKFNTETPQDKIRFVLQVLSGPELGTELWNIENLPPPFQSLVATPKHRDMWLVVLDCVVKQSKSRLYSQQRLDRGEVTHD